VLAWVSSEPTPTQQSLQEWMRHRYELGTESSTPPAYVSLIMKMGYLSSQRDSVVLITVRGKQLLETRNPAIVLDGLMLECIGFYEVLECVARVGSANGKLVFNELQDRFPYWKSTAQYEWRLGWLHSLGCLERSARVYICTGTGRGALSKYEYSKPPLPPATASAVQTREGTPQTSRTFPDLIEETEPDAPVAVDDDPPAPLLVVKEEGDRLAERIKRASLESDDATGFERVLVETFRFLGFEAEHRSGPGDTDVLVKAPLGQETFSAVIDGKSSRHGKVSKQQIDWWALGRHKTQHRADYILVVAPGFSSGDLLDNAAKTEAALITADDLAAVVRLHGSTPLSLTDLRELFRYVGHPELPLQRIQEKAAEVARLQRLLPDILRTFERSYQVGIMGPLTADALHLRLALDYGRAEYSKEEIETGLELLCTPLIGALRRVNDTTHTIQMPITSVGRRFQAQARQLLDAGEQTRGDMIAISNTIGRESPRS
jgi:hypothetical protein